LIEKTEQEGEGQAEVKEGDFSFSFAKVWAADKDAMEDIQEDDQADSWTQTLQKIMAEREKSERQEIVASGRGVRRAAASYKVGTNDSINSRYCLT
jgi:chromodomain-helicase-DNA-binding protein 4